MKIMEKKHSIMKKLVGKDFEKKLSLLVLIDKLNNNVGEAMDKLLEHVPEQTEIFCIDTGYDSDVENQVKEWEKADSRVKYVRSQRNCAGHALNLGIRSASGKYLAFANLDDIRNDEMYLNLINIAEETDADMIQCDTKEEKLSDHASYYGRNITPDEEPQCLAFVNHVRNGVYRTSLLKDKKIFFPEIPGQYWPKSAFYMNLVMQSGKVYYCEEPMISLAENRKFDSGTEVFLPFQEYEAVQSLLRKDEKLKNTFGMIFSCESYRGLSRRYDSVPARFKKAYMERMATYMKDLHDSGNVDYYAFSPEERFDISSLMLSPQKHYEWKTSNSVTGETMEYMFPYHLFNPGEKVLIYGMDCVGMMFYRQAVNDGYVQVVGMTDMNVDDCHYEGLPVYAIEDIKNLVFDAVIISACNQDEAGMARENLIVHRVPENKIKWDGNAYARDGFYKQVFMPLLSGVQPGQKAADISSVVNERKEIIDQLHKIVPANENILDGLKLRMQFFYRHIFPYHLFKEGERVVIYGAGDIGREFYRQAKHFSWVKIISIIDKNADKINIPDIPVGPIDSIKQYDFDSVLISIHDEKIAEEARRLLWKKGITNERIKWCGKLYYMDEFYNEYWFKYLRFVHKMRESKI